MRNLSQIENGIIRDQVAHMHLEIEGEKAIENE